MIDTNGDGTVNERDVPAVVLATLGNPIAGQVNELVALRGDTGEKIFAVRCPDLNGWSTSGHSPAVRSGFFGYIPRPSPPLSLPHQRRRQPCDYYENETCAPEGTCDIRRARLCRISFADG